MFRRRIENRAERRRGGNKSDQYTDGQQAIFNSVRAALVRQEFRKKTAHIHDKRPFLLM
jgi:hypothetical protein